MSGQRRSRSRSRRVVIPINLSRRSAIVPKLRSLKLVREQEASLYPGSLPTKNPIRKPAQSPDSLHVQHVWAIALLHTGSTRWFPPDPANYRDWLEATRHQEGRLHLHIYFQRYLLMLLTSPILAQPVYHPRSIPASTATQRRSSRHLTTFRQCRSRRRA